MPVPTISARRPMQPTTLPPDESAKLRRRGDAAISVIRMAFMTMPDAQLVRAVVALTNAEAALTNDGSSGLTDIGSNAGRRKW